MANFITRFVQAVKGPKDKLFVENKTSSVVYIEVKDYDKFINGANASIGTGAVSLGGNRERIEETQKIFLDAHRNYVFDNVKTVCIVTVYRATEDRRIAKCTSLIESIRVNISDPAQNPYIIKNTESNKSAVPLGAGAAAASTGAAAVVGTAYFTYLPGALWWSSKAAIAGFQVFNGAILPTVWGLQTAICLGPVIVTAGAGVGTTYITYKIINNGIPYLIGLIHNNNNENNQIAPVWNK